MSNIEDIKKLIENETDPSMKKYYESLLGNINEVYSPKDDPRVVVITELRIVHEDRPGNDDVYTLDTEEQAAQVKKRPFTLYEGENYRLVVSFRVQHNIVAGLKIENVVTRGGVPVDKDLQMLGSYRPQKEIHQVSFPKNDWDEAPSGMLARGSYTGKMSFLDDDKKTHLKFEYTFKIEKK